MTQIVDETGLELPPSYLQIPETLNFADLVVTKHVREGRAERPAIHYEGRTYTYADVEAYTNRSGNALRSLGIERGDHFVIRAPNSLAYAGLFLGGLKLGAVPIPSNSLFRAWEIEHMVRNSEAKLVFVAEEFRGPVDEVSGQCPTLEDVIPIESWDERVAGESDELEALEMHRDDPAFMIYTSGTTAKPKGVEHAHRLIVADGDPVAWTLMQLRPDDVVMQPQEISFIYSLICGLLFPLYAGAQAALYPGRFDVDRAMEAVQRYRVTEFVAVPTIYRMMLAVPDLEERYDLSSVRMGISGGEPLPEDTYRESKRRFGFEIYDLIGQTEAVIWMSNRPGLPVKPGSLGKALPGRIGIVADEDGNELPPREIGHLVIKDDDPAIALWYRHQDDLWRERFRNGWFYTGDLGYRDEDGYYWYVSRDDDLIKSRAYLISPKEVEAATMEHRGVLESGVVGVPDELIGQRVKAYVVLKPGSEPSDAMAEEIKETVRSVIAPYKCPREIEFVAELPKTATGKIQRKVLREQPGART
jgi:acyl-coenzyme A synthetase/AMP-(fatty) acid ligase